MIVLDKIRKYTANVKDKRKMRRGINLEIGDLVLADNDASGFCFTPGKEYRVLNICPISEARGIRNFHLSNVLFKLVDDNGTMKEVSYRFFDY